MRTILLATTLALSTALVAPATAEANQLKAEWKETKKDAKTIAKLTKKYGKKAPKGKHTKYEAEIQAWAKGELQDLRAMGVKTKDAKPVHPREGGGKEDMGRTEWQDKLVDTLKDVRDLRAPGKRLPAMQKATKMYEGWAERRKAKFKGA
jgi:hypothetical protein